MDPTLHALRFDSLDRRLSFTGRLHADGGLETPPPLIAPVRVMVQVGTDWLSRVTTRFLGRSDPQWGTPP
jgi:hypothetical protein